MIFAKSSKFNAGGCHAGQRADPVEERVNGRVADDEIDCGNDSNGIVALTPARMGEHGDAFAVVQFWMAPNNHQRGIATFVCLQTCRMMVLGGDYSPRRMWT